MNDRGGSSKSCRVTYPLDVPRILRGPWDLIYRCALSSFLFASPRSLARRLPMIMKDPAFWAKKGPRRVVPKKVNPLVKDGDNFWNKIFSTDYSLKGLVTEFFKRTSLMGLQQMGNRRSYIWKGFWAVVFTCAASMAIYQSWHLMDDYIQGKSVQSTVYSASHPFPTVTVCSNIHVAAVMEESIGAIVDSTLISKDKTLLLKYLASVNASVRGSYEFAGGRGQKTLLKGCTFDKVKCDKNDPRVLHFFETIYFGSCFTFNIGTDEPMPANPNSILTLKVDMERNSRQLAYNENFINVWVTPPGNAPILNKNDGAKVYPGDIANIKYNMKQVVRMKKRASDCIDESDLARREQSVYYTAKTPYLYSQQACVASLMFKENMKAFGCVDPAVPWSDQVEIDIGNGVYNVCSTAGEDSRSTPDGEDEADFSNFEQNCSLPCSEWIVDNAVSTTSTWYEALVDASLKSSGKAKTNTSVTLKDIKFDSRYANIKVFHGSPIVELVVEEYKYNSGDFAGVIGGNVGLWMGACVISFLETFEMLVNFLIGKFLHCCGGKRRLNPRANVARVQPTVLGYFKYGK